MTRRSAVVYPVATTTGRVLFGLRSRLVSHLPETWAGFGGSTEHGEDSADAALRELEEETGYSGPIELTLVDEYREGPYHITAFVGMVPDEFPPILNWEHDNAKWVDQEEFTSIWRTTK